MGGILAWAPNANRHCLGGPVARFDRALRYLITPLDVPGGGHPLDSGRNRKKMRGIAFFLSDFLCQGQSVYDKARYDRPRRQLNSEENDVPGFSRTRQNVVGDAVNLVYLSTHPTPRDRLRRIARIRDDDGDENWWLVISIQFVEGGVDISMDEVYRDLAPLDAIIHAAGRCNGSGERGRGRVTVLRLVDALERPFSRWVYDPILLQVTERLLEGHDAIDEGAFLSLGETYFRRMWAATSPDEDLLDALGALDFEMLAGVRLVEHQGKTQSYFVLAEDDPDAEKLWETYRAVREEELDREAFQRIKRPFLERVIHVRVRGAVEDEILPLYPDGEEHHDEEVGYQHGDQSIQLFRGSSRGSSSLPRVGDRGTFPGQRRPVAAVHNGHPPG